MIDLGSTTSDWPDLSWSTNLPFGKELVGDFDNDGTPDSESSSNYFGLTGDLSNGLVGYWNFNESSLDSAPGGQDFADLSGFGNRLFESGSVTLNNIGKMGTAVKLDGVDDYIDFQEQAAVQLGFNSPFTISLWLKLPPKQVDLGHNTNRILDRRGVSSAHTFNVYNENAIDEGKIHYNFDNGSTNNNLISNKKINDNIYHYLSVTYDGVLAKVYIDSQLDNQISISVTSVESLTSLRLGNQSSGFIGLNGSVDEFGFWNKALSAQEIQQLYRRGANRIKFQVKSCVDSNCECKSLSASPAGSASDCDGDTIVNALDFDDIHKAEFIGPGGDGTTYYSELFNRKATDLTFNFGLNTSDSNSNICVNDEITLGTGPRQTGPVIDYSNFPLQARPVANPYFQYRVYMEADENTACEGSPCLPELTSVNLNPNCGNKYFGALQEVKPNKPISYSSIQSATIAADSCATFQLSADGTNYMYWNSGSWVPATDPSHLTNRADVENNIVEFGSQYGPGLLYIKSFLQTNSSQNFNCSIQSVDVDYVGQ